MQKEETQLFIPKELGDHIEILRKEVAATIRQVQKYYPGANNNRFQDIVIGKLENSIKSDFKNSLIYDIGIANLSKASMINAYYNTVLSKTPAKKFMKVAVMCSSKGELEILPEDLEEWLEKLKLNLHQDKSRANPHRKYLENWSTKRQAINNLTKMIAFPVSVKNTLVNSDTFLTEDVMDSLMANDPEKYLPAGALKYIKNGGRLDTILLSTASAIEYDRTVGERTMHIREEARIKSKGAFKLAKYVVGPRTLPHADEVGMRKIVEQFSDIDSATAEVISLKNPKIREKLDNRYADDILRSNVPAKAEEYIMDLLRRPYLTLTGDVDIERAKEARKYLIYGNWVDINFSFKQGPAEVQIKDRFGEVLSDLNSPMGHNGLAYAKIRKEEAFKTKEVLGVQRTVDKIVEYIAKDILLPGYNIGRK